MAERSDPSAVEAVARVFGEFYETPEFVAKYGIPEVCMIVAQVALAAINYDDTLAELERLRAENERLRTTMELALEFAARHGYVPSDAALDQPTERPQANRK